MARTEELKVYKASYDMFLAVFPIIHTYTREYRYTIWEEIKKECTTCIVHIYRANSSYEKRYENIETAIESLQVVRLLFRLSNDLKQIPIKKFASINILIEDVSMQLSGWKKASEKYKKWPESVVSTDIPSVPDKSGISPTV